MVHNIGTLGESHNEKWNLSIVQAKIWLIFKIRNIKLIPASTENVNKYFQKLFNKRNISKDKIDD